VSGKHNVHNFYFFGGKNEEKKKKSLEMLDLARKLIKKKFLEIVGPRPTPKKIGLKENKKCLELPDLARKLVRKIENFIPPLQTCAPENFRSW
jgi:hypothetical protein